MLKQVILDLDENLFSETTSIFNYFGLDLQTGIKMYLTRVAKEKSISFLLNQVYKTPTEANVIKNNNIISNNEIKMTKTAAIRLLLNKKNKVARTVTFATKNRGAYNYWANPPFEILKDNWSLILNDNIQRKLYLFYIPANAITEKQLISRADKPSLIDLQIMYNDITFTDNRSQFSFSKFLINEVAY